MKKILLLSPNMKGMKDGINRIQPSLGLGYLASVLEEKGYQVFVRDTALEDYGNQKLLEDGKTVFIGETNDAIQTYIEKIKPDAVGISVLFSNLAAHAFTIAEIVKKINPKTPVILGGNHISNSVSDYEYALSEENSGLPETLPELENPFVDYLIRGEGENALPELLEALFTDKNPETIRGLAFKKEGKIIINPWPLPVDINALPHPARRHLNMEKYFQIGLFHSSKSKSTRVLNVMTSRGCPEKCNFCTTPMMWGKNIRWRTPEDVFSEIKEAVETYGIKEVQFEDDSLTANLPHLMKLCYLLEPLKIDWCTPNGIKVNYYLKDQPKMFSRMKESGCYQVTLACESGVQEILDNVIGKRLNLSEIKPAVKNAKDAGLFVHTFWIVGFPGETKAQMEETIRFAADVEADSYSVAILTPLPGTPIYRHVVKNKLWWKPDLGTGEIMYRNSLVKADGFKTAKEFEDWVNEQNIYLNSLIEKRDPERARRRAESIANQEANKKMKQT